MNPSTLVLLSDSERLFCFALNFSCYEILNPSTLNLRLEQELVQKEAADAALCREKEVKIKHQILFKLQMLTNFNPTDIKQIKIIFRQGIERSRGDRGEMVLVQTTKMSNFETLCTNCVSCPHQEISHDLMFTKLEAKGNFTSFQR